MPDMREKDEEVIMVKNPYGRKATGRPSGRPEKEIDWKKVDELMICGCTGTEIASTFDMHPDTFYLRVEKKYNLGFTAYLQQKRQTGDSLLRAKQYQKAMNGDNTLLVWLGKNRLKQSDNPNNEQSVSDSKIGEILDLAKLRAENAELKRILNESQARIEHIPSEQETEHLVRSSTEREDI